MKNNTNKVIKNSQGDSIYFDSSDYLKGSDGNLNFKTNMNLKNNDNGDLTKLNIEGYITNDKQD